ncbi:hypothetical protein DINM_003359 [Dirofilaria immitis]|nr:hypothetical protein [Dirofilaria immitis]
MIIESTCQYEYNICGKKYRKLISRQCEITKQPEIRKTQKTKPSSDTTPRPFTAILRPKYSKELQWGSLHRLKRDKFSDTPQVSKGILPYEVTKVLTTVSSTLLSDPKRLRPHYGSSIQSDKVKLSGRIPHVVLEECLKYAENGDKSGIFSRLREFFGEHLCVLNVDSQIYCTKLLIQIATSFSSIWYICITVSSFEWGIAEGLIVGQYMQQINCVAEESTRSSALYKSFMARKLLSKMAEDRDSRVRIAAVKGLSTMTASGRLLNFSIYQQVKNLCENSSKIVRTEALHILKVFADHRPEIEIIGRNGAKLRLVDDAFATVCHAINDVEVTVRATAARLLGDFQQMSKTRDGASKNLWRMDFDVDARKQQLNGACGAFVTALEDEFMSMLDNISISCIIDRIVRQAGVYSLGQLAADRPFLAAAALDHLADMFNDEIEQVRLDAVRALTPLVVHGILQKEQLDTILTVLDDVFPDSREALRVLLSKSTLGTPDCLRYVVKALLNCMRRFPIDRQSIFKCMSDLGRRHATFVQLLSDELLELHPVFDIMEPAVDDQFYLAKLILILNAASAHDPVCSLLPAFVVRHYKFLRCSMPLLVPMIEHKQPFYQQKLIEAGERTRILLERTYEMMQKASQSRSDVNALCEGDEGIAGTAQFLSCLLKILMQCELSVKILSYGGDLQTALNAVDEGLRLLERIDNFSSIDKVMLATLEEFHFQFSILRLAVLFDIKPGAYTNAVRLIEMEVIRFKEQCRLLAVCPSESTAELLLDIEGLLVATQMKKFINGSRLTALFQCHSVLLQKKFASLGSISIKWAQIVEPAETPSEPLRFVVGLPLGISINILLHNFKKTDYPDRSSILFCPRENDFKEIAAQTYRLLCKVIVQADNLWSDSARVRFGCVLKSQQFVDVISPSVSGFIRSSCVAIAESPFSNKQAAMEIPIQPIQAKASC